MLSGYGDSLTQPKLEYITTSCAVSFVQIQVSRVVDINESSEGIIPYLSIKKFFMFFKKTSLHYTIVFAIGHQTQ